MKSTKTVQVRSVSRSRVLVTMIFVRRNVKAQNRRRNYSTPNCERTIKADVVAFDQPFFYNRLGAVNPAGMIYALRRDVKAKSSAGLVPGNVHPERVQTRAPDRPAHERRRLLSRSFSKTCSIQIVRTIINPPLAPPAFTPSVSTSETAFSTTAQTSARTRAVSSLPVTASPTRFTPKKKAIT